MPAIGKILIVFVSMLGLSRMGVHLGAALIFGGVALNVWAGLAFSDSAANLGSALVSSELWLMIIVCALVVEFGRFMTEKENADEIVAFIKRWGGRHGRTWSLIAIPAVVGLIPMPAGALFSAPLVDKSADEAHWTGEWKSAINYWFRHIWEYWWPLYPGVIVAMALFNMPNWRFFATQIPFTVVAVAVGYLALLHSHVSRLAVTSEPAQYDKRRLAFVALPLVVVICGAMTMPPIVGRLWPALTPQDEKMLAMLSGLLMGLIIIVWRERKDGRGTVVFGSLLKPKSLSMLFTIAGVMVFKCLLDTSGLVETACHEMQDGNVNLVYVVACLPFLAGLITGVAVGFTGASFPLVVALMNSPSSGLTPMSTLVLAYGCGYMGMIISPVHLCLLVTKDYFDASMPAIYRKLLPCIGVVLVYSICVHALLLALGW